MLFKIIKSEIFKQLCVNSTLLSPVNSWLKHLGSAIPIVALVWGGWASNLAAQTVTSAIALPVVAFPESGLSLTSITPLSRQALSADSYEYSYKVALRNDSYERSQFRCGNK